MSDNSDDVRSFPLPTVAAIVSILKLSEHRQSSLQFNARKSHGRTSIITLKYLPLSDPKNTPDWAMIHSPRSITGQDLLQAATR